MRVVSSTAWVDAPVRGFRATLVPTIEPPPKAGNAVAFFVSGPAARTLREATTSGSREVVFRQFESTVTLHAVEYIAMRGPAAAVAEGRVEVRVRDGSVVPAVVPMTHVPTMLKVVFDATPPPEHTLAPLDLEMDLGVRTSTLPVTRIDRGVPLDLAIVTGANYYVRARATRGAAVSDSGRVLVDPALGTISLVMPAPISSEAPIDDGAPATGAPSSPPVLDAGGVLAARFANGVVEHVLAPESGDGPIVRVLTSSRATTLPDATTMGLPRPTGRYLWTVRAFPLLPHIDNLSGQDARVKTASWTSAPKVIVVR